MVAKKPEVDAACRAEIPPMLSQKQRDALAYAPRCRQRWGERQIEGATPPLKAEDIQEFLTEFAWLKETELALWCLFDGEFDVPKAVGLLHTARRERYKARRNLDERLPPEAFKDAVATHGKKFHLVKQQALGQKTTTREVVSKYYLWKRTDDFKNWWKLQRAKKTRKTRKEVERLRQLADESDPETEAYLSYHNELCELCATGGNLLCCDGCARAYHISCAQPPITKVPDEDWYCLHCQEAFGGPRPRLIPSDENEYCMTCPPLPGFQHSLIESMTDTSSYKDEQEDSSYDEYEDGVSLQSSDDNDRNSNVDDYPSTEELSSNAGNPGSHTDNESEGTSAKNASSSPASDRSRSSKVEQNLGPTVHSPTAKQQTRGAEVQPAGPSIVGASQEAIVEQAAGSFPMGVRRPPTVQLERSGSGRKRHRKMLAPRRIPPSRFDS
ncbi:hypothetical protein PHYPSEUDO_008690 [Phytophthora pseudosyringae]|uniref:PHD-type domain-containing protein n=1 Tax=Phytophthora pseudosyringae TaxID=221518 RepID=A0A8T1VGJ9_9STRA|nr:hypothetical protein PHYPSEUDO_008690 [Phytophthora pseudosyringae]